MRSRLAARQDLRHKIRALRRSCAPRANHLYTMGRNLLAEDIRRSIAAPLASSLEWLVIRDFSVKDLFSANRDSCGNASVRVSQKPPVGQITENLSSPQRKNIPLSPSGKSALPARAVSPDERGGSRSSRTCGGMRWTRIAAKDERRYLVRRSRVVLTPRRWCQVRERLTLLGSDGDNKARSPRRARRKPLKPLRREGRMLSAEPVCSCAFSNAQFAHETAGAARTRSSLRPLAWEGQNSCKPRAQSRREIANPYSTLSGG